MTVLQKVKAEMQAFYEKVILQDFDAHRVSTMDLLLRLGVAATLENENLNHLVKAEYRAKEMKTIIHELAAADSLPAVFQRIELIEKFRHDRFLEGFIGSLSKPQGIAALVQDWQREAEARLLQRDIPRLKEIVDKAVATDAAGSK